MFNTRSAIVQRVAAIEQRLRCAFALFEQQRTATKETEEQVFIRVVRDMLNEKEPSRSD